jgi:hypothetical protein
MLYVKYIRQFHESIKIMDQQNAYIYSEYDYLMFESSRKTEPYYKKVILIKNYKSRLINIIDSIQSPIDTINLTKIYNNDYINSRQLNRKVNLKPSDIELIKTNIARFKTTLFSLIDNEKKESELIKDIDSILVIEKLLTIPTYNSNEVGLLELLACLSKLKLDITLAESDMLFYLIYQIDDGSYKFSTIKPIVVPNSQLIPIGYPYHAEIFLVAYDTISIPIYEIDGKKFEAPGCTGNYSCKVLEKSGKHSKDGNFIVKSPNTGKIQKIPFKIEYEVLEKK